MVGSVPAIAGKQPHLRFPAQTAIVFAQSFEQIWLSITSRPCGLRRPAREIRWRPCLMRDFQAGQFGPPDACGIECPKKNSLERVAAASMRLFTSSG
jgi:hypothetical protein